MHSRKQLANVINQILTSEEQDKFEAVEESTVDEYQKLNKSCDEVLEKIKKRKSK